MGPNHQRGRPVQLTEAPAERDAGIERGGMRMDAQYKFLKTVCKLSKGERWVTYSEIKEHWSKCPDRSVLLNLANHSYVTVSGMAFFPNPEAFSYVRQCKDSIRNLVITTTTLLVSVGAFLTSLYAL